MRNRNPAKECWSKAAHHVARLACDKRGNTLAIVAAAVFPIMAVVGGGLDLARAHVVKSRLNEACDAAALAGRRAMANEDVETAKPEATKFFGHNFTQGYLGSSAFTPTITKPDVGTIRVAASTVVPTTLMRIFGYDTIPVSVTCDATQNFDNIDIVLVLDTTGSMQYNLAGTTKQSSDSNANAKMYMLRQAVMALYDQLKPAQDQLAAQGLRLRYGIVPYSSAVNVGKLVYAKNNSYILSGNQTFNSRARVSGNWRYKHVNYNITSSYLSGSGSLTTPTGSNGSNESHSWGGCIEERQTVSTITSSTPASSVPSGANDLDIDLIPSSDATKWRPYLAGPYLGDDNYVSPIYGRDSASSTDDDDGFNPQTACPREASRLATMTRNEMLNYVNSMHSDGGTYHDIGMIWGARFISGGGIFGGDNPSVVNDRPVRRYIIFMTDGILDTGETLHSSYGIEKNDKRVTGGFTSEANQIARHKQRFLIACNEAKKKGVSIWSIVFASATESTLSACASNDDQYKVTATGTDLVNTFKEIGKNIGALRLSK